MRAIAGLFAVAFLAAPAAGGVIDFDRPSAGAPEPTATWLTQLLGQAAPPPPAIVGRPLVAARILAGKDGALLSEAGLAQRLARTRLVFVGEQHTLPSSHDAELSVIRALEREPGFSVGLEMVDETQQAALDDYIAGRVDDAAFERFWKTAWGYPYSLYQPILEHCRARRIPLKALNAPIAIVRRIARRGLASLSPQQRQLLAQRVDPISDPAYLAWLKRELAGHGPMTPVQEARMMEAMAAWNETMGDNAVKAVGASGTMVVLVGAGHVVLRAGILASVRSRASVGQAVVLPYPMDGTPRPEADLRRELRDPANAALADYFWLLVQ